MKKWNKKGFTLDQVPAAVMMLVVIAIVIGLGSTVLSNIQATQTTNSYAANATISGLQGLKTVSDFQPTIAIVVVAGVILGIVAMVLIRRM